MLAHLQRSGATYFGRYFNEYSVLRRLTPSDEGLKILSFGCAGGEELATLRAFFPGASLYGCDVDWTELARARALVGRDAVVMESRADLIASAGPFDVIVCNSVLVDKTTVQDGVARALDPAIWRSTLDLLDDALVPGGLLQIVNANIPFRLHPRAAGYRPVRSPLILGPHFVDLFDVEGALLCSGAPTFWKSELVPYHFAEAGADRLTPDDFHDVHFRKQGGAGVPDDIADEIAPNLAFDRVVASGSTSYRPAPLRRPRDVRLVTSVEIDVAWSASITSRVRLERTMRRIWFDGDVALTRSATIDLDGAEAAAFIDAVTGRRSADLAFRQLVSPEMRGRS
jgi:hypothetical protein